jgi:hypothetical protein
MNAPKCWAPPEHRRRQHIGCVYTGVFRDLRFEVTLQAVKDDAGVWGWRPVVSTTTTAPGEQFGIAYGKRADYLTPGLSLALSALLTEATDLARTLPGPVEPLEPFVRDQEEPEIGMTPEQIRRDERRQVVAELKATLADQQGTKRAAGLRRAVKVVEARMWVS